MKKMVKKYFAILLSLTLVMSLVACSNDKKSVDTNGGTTDSKTEDKKEDKKNDDSNDKKEDDAKPLEVYFISPMVGGAAWGICERGFLEKCEELGWNGHWLGPNTIASVTEMVELAETAVSNNADIIIGAWNDMEAYNSTLQRAKDDGIILLGYNYFIEGFTEAYLGIDPIKLGQVQAETLDANFPKDEQIHYVYMQGNLASQSHIINHDAFFERITELRPNAVEVSWEECHSNVQEANEKMSALVLANPEINAFVGNDGNGSIGVAALVEERDMYDMYVQGIDGGGEILQAVVASTMDCTVIQDWYTAGQLAAELALKVYNGETVDQFTGAGAYALYADGVQQYADDNGIDY